MIPIVRSEEAPASLADKSGWRGDDVLEALYADFLGKCYLCERPTQPHGFEVDHRIQRAWNAWTELDYDWTNLCLACEDCNKRRPTAEPAEAPLDPAVHDIDQRLVQTWDVTNNRPVFGPTNLDDESAKQTSKELKHLHSHLTPKGQNLLTAIRSYRSRVAFAERDFLAESDPREKSRLRNELAQLLSKTAPFTALIRSGVLPAHAELFD